jgi:hypothetical protein
MILRDIDFLIKESKLIENQIEENQYKENKMSMFLD